MDACTTPHERTLALKALWREHDALSCCAPLAGKLAALAAAKAGATPIEANYVGQGYAIPDDWTWERVALHRAHNGTAAHMVPLAEAGGAVAWGTPIIAGAFLLHPGNIAQKGA